MNEYIKKLVKSGIEVTICYDKDKDLYYYDLNSHCKSYMHLYIEKNSLEGVILCRNNKSYEIKTFEDILECFLWLYYMDIPTPSPWVELINSIYGENYIS